METQATRARLEASRASLPFRCFLYSCVVMLVKGFPQIPDFPQVVFQLSSVKAKLHKDAAAEGC
jgi:hypothetical protein